MCMGLTFCCYLPVHVPRCDSAWEPPWCSVPNTSTKSGRMLWGEDPVAAWTMENEIKRQLWAPQWRENTLFFYPKIKGKMKLSTRSPFDKKLKEFLPSWATKRLPSAVSTICSICFFTKRWVLGLVVTARKLRRLCFYRCLSFCPQGGGACMVFPMRYGQWAGGTHPTGMHSCFYLFFVLKKPWLLTMLANSWVFSLLDGVPSVTSTPTTGCPSL